MHNSSVRLLPLVPLLFAAAPPPLEPSGPWGIDYGANRCTLYRVFGGGHKVARLTFEQTAPRRSVSVMVAGSALKPSADRNSKLTFNPRGASIYRGKRIVTTGTKESGVYFSRALTRGKFGLLTDAAGNALAMSLPPGKASGWWSPGFTPRPAKWEEEDWRRDPPSVIEAETRAFSDRAALVQSVTLDAEDSRPITLHTESLKAPLEALEKCARDSLKDWGVDPLVEAAVVVSPHPANDMVRILTPKDYPRKAISAGMESSLDLWLNIDSQGGISNCRVISTFDSPDINDQMCKLVKQRQTFVAAKTADGSPVASYYIESFRFVIAR